jgi:uncharacterized protein (TIGR03437 family)
MTFWLWLLSFSSLASAASAETAVPKITAAPDGPYHVRGNRIVDAHSREFLVRGTRLPVVPLAAAVDAAAEDDSGFGPFSGTTLITIRQRLNMNAVRVAVDAREYQTNKSYRTRVQEIVHQVNQFELLAILEPASEGSTASFWLLCAADFKSSPNVFFAAPSEEDAHAIRSTGAAQPILVRTAATDLKDLNIIYEFSPSFATLEKDVAELTALSQRVPVLVNGLDPQLDRAGPPCSAFPEDPGAAAKLMEDLLTGFDEHSISWTISTLKPGKLIDNYRFYDWTKLDVGWTCGAASRAGIAMDVLSHLWDGSPHGVFTVNQPGGGLVIARGGNASAYGRILAAREAHADGWPLPVKLANISVRVTDSRGVARLAPLSWTGAGWANVNLIIPPDSSTGPAEVAVIRSDGSKTASRVIIADVAPAFWTGPADGRGPVIGQVVQSFPNGKIARLPAWTCSKDGCRAVPIPLTPRASTSVRLEGTGFRYASSIAAVQVIIDGVSVPVESFGPIPQTSRDQVTVKLPDQLIGRGEVDVRMIVDGALSNVARMNCGRQP